MPNRVIVLGGGPSLTRDAVDRLDPAEVIACNEAARICPAAAVLFARDESWCRQNQELIWSWPGLAITTSRRASQDLPMEFVVMERRPDFPAALNGVVSVIRYGPSSGHASVSWAVSAGAQRIVLLGFDGRAVAGRTHWHDQYREDRLEAYARFNHAWQGWAAAAGKLGCEILNATPGSAIGEFPMIGIDEALA